MPTKKFEPDDFAAFLKLLPATCGSLSLRHAVEVRHDSFLTPDFIALARKAKVAVVFADTPKYPQIADLTADFAYARLQDAQAEIETGYDDPALDRWAGVAKAWAAGAAPEGLSHVAEAEPAPIKRDVFMFMINGAKERAPAAAKALIGRL